jgi:hypothetical protein
MIYFIIYLILPLLIIHVIYGLAIFFLVIVFHKLRIFQKKRILLSFLITGIITGFLIVWLWLYDVIILINPFVAFIGSEVYQLSIFHLGDPNSSQAHFTIPWFLRIPQVYFLTSILVWGFIGLFIQLVNNWKNNCVEKIIT